MRAALGASAGRLARQTMMESALLALLGAVAGLAIAQWGAAGLRAWFLPADLHAAVLTDGRTLAFAATAVLLVTFITGLAPAMGAARTDVATSLKAGGRVSDGGSSRLRTGLLLAQAALSLVLLVGAALFVQSMRNIDAYPLGYDPDRILFATGNTRGVRLDSAHAMALNDRLLAAAQSTPGVTHAALAASIPFWSNEGRGLFVPGVDSVSRRGTFIMQAGTPDYFRTMGTRILQGRAFDDTDRAGGPRVVVVSEGMSRVLWQGEAPLGRCIRIGSDTAPCTTVIGVAEEARIRSLLDDREFAYYVPAAQLGEPLYMQVLVRVTGAVEEVGEALRARLQAELPAPAYIRVIPMTSLVDPSRRSWRFGAVMFVAFGVLALVIAAVGLYSMIAYDVAQRTRDLGVRIALGARAGQIVRLVVTRGVALVAAGIVVGTAIALWLAPRFDPLLYGQTARDPAIIGAAAVALIAVGLAAAALPAFRAARVDPAIALRAD
jgi:predicted permease